MTPDDRVRLFVAAPIPDGARRELERVADTLRAEWPDARWIDPDNQHVTLKFLGWTTADAIDPIATACRAVAEGRMPAPLALSSLGSFPGGRRARVLWVGLDDPSSLLAGLASDLDGALAAFGFPVEARAFTPHLTLARFKVPRALALPEVEIAPARWTCERVVLFRSHLSPKGARYEGLTDLALGGG